MKRTLLITFSFLSIGAATAQDVSPDAPTNLDSFRVIVQKNIFDPTRSGHYHTHAMRAAPTVNAFTFSGTAGEAAYLEGSGVPRRGFVLVGDQVNGFKVRQITLHTLTLTDPSGKIWLLNRDESMRQELNGPWAKFDEPAPTTVTSTDTTVSAPTFQSTPSSVSAAPGVPANITDILTRLRLKREQEEK